MNPDHFPPPDLAYTIHTLQTLIAELEDWTGEMLVELFTEYDDDCEQWDHGGPEPDWDYYREEINDILTTSTYPILFPDVEPIEAHTIPLPEAPDAHLDADMEDRLSGGGDWIEN